MISAKRSLVALAGVALVLSGAAFVPAGARPAVAAVRFHSHPIAALNANQSNNWSGYNQGQIERGNAGFHSVTGDWTVPKASAHRQFEQEASSSWIGIGGGCVDAQCNQTDNTLIQTGTEQDVVWDPTQTPATQSQYSAWYELIPDQATPIPSSSLPVKAGDQFHADIHENGNGSGKWTITLSNVTQAKSFSINVNYTSTYATAEWIEEAPIVVSVYPPAAGFAPLPDLTPVHFDTATANGSNAALKPSEQVQMVDLLTGNVTATPSGVDPDADGFNVCTYSTTCAAPTTSSGPVSRSSRTTRRSGGHRH